MAEKLRDETKQKDLEKRGALEAIGKRASLKLRDRERVSSALQGRVDETDNAVRTSSAGYAAAHSALKAVERLHNYIVEALRPVPLTRNGMKSQLSDLARGYGGAAGG